jgi:glutamate 5-kinase
MDELTTQADPYQRLVLKVGSALVAPGDEGVSTQHLLGIARFIIAARERGREVILVSSGAVAAGRIAQDGAARRGHLSIPEKQGLAAVGQPLLMAHWNRLFDFPCAQVLLTHGDLHDRTRFVNAKNTLSQLLDLGTLPVVNENDTVATEELGVGDNDNLAAHVAVLAEADALVLCTDVDGLYDADPRTHPDAQLVPVVDDIDEHIYAMAGGGAGTHAAIGGMRTKIEAAEKATARGIDTMIVNGTDAARLDALHDGTVRGTLFRRAETPMGARKHWMLHALPSAGRILVDEGAADALRRRGASLLPPGVVGAEGDFSRGDAVEIAVSNNGSGVEVIAKGITQYGGRDLRRIRGHQSDEVRRILEDAPAELVVQRDDLVVMRDS